MNGRRPRRVERRAELEPATRRAALLRSMLADASAETANAQQRLTRLHEQLDLIEREIDAAMSERLAAQRARNRTRANQGARLVALELAVAGASRAVVARRLHDDFRLDDPAPIIDDVFGAARPAPA